MSNMIFSVHGYFKKTDTRKMPRKLEVLVYSTDEDSAMNLVEKLFSKHFNADLFNFSVVGGSDKSLEELYEERPELRGISPETGFIYHELYWRREIDNYYK